jgi:hypothetical protein
MNSSAYSLSKSQSNIEKNTLIGREKSTSCRFRSEHPLLTLIIPGR